MKPWFMDAMTVILQNKQRLVEKQLLGIGAGDAVFVDGLALVAGQAGACMDAVIGGPASCRPAAGQPAAGSFEP